MQNLVSVLLPVHNGGVWLADAVASVLAQSWRALELLVIDDHSSDGAVDGLPRDDLRLRVLPSPSRGIVAALNTGLAAARGGWIARMDADDICAPERIAAQMAYAAACPQIDIVASRVDLIDTAVDSGLWRYIAWSNALTEPEDIACELFIDSPLVHPTVLLRSDLLRQLGGWRDGDFPEDYELWLRAAQAGCRFGKPEPALLHWRDHRPAADAHGPALFARELPAPEGGAPGALAPRRAPGVDRRRGAWRARAARRAAPRRRRGDRLHRCASAPDWRRQARPAGMALRAAGRAAGCDRPDRSRQPRRARAGASGHGAVGPARGRRLALRALTVALDGAGSTRRHGGRGEEPNRLVRVMDGSSPRWRTTKLFSAPSASPR
ncbi:MAG: glycosyltransferase [Rhodanobacteraceae bacterium]|nr:glycosyltransferase [Rhodanobacteraceae bacterium]